MHKMLNVRDYIFKNITPYNGDESFLSGPSARTKALWDKCLKLLEKERQKDGLLDVDTKTISGITSFAPGYIKQDLELIVGLQTDAPLKRAMKPAGGIRTVEKALQDRGLEMDKRASEIFNKYRKTHNDGVFDAYTTATRVLRSTHTLTGLPDNYSRGRIIGDYRRIALYGIDRLIEEKNNDKLRLENVDLTDEVIRLREEISEQIRALQELKKMAAAYGDDISRPAASAREAIQWIYYGYLGATKQQDGAAMSMGNITSFIDIYIENDLRSGDLNEEDAQELIDHFVMKLRLIRHLRAKEYEAIFAGDPTWVTITLGGKWCNGQHKITKTDYRFLQTLYNMGPAPEPNMTVLYAKTLPLSWRDFVAKVSLDTSSLQYENDDLMQPFSGDDYGISCCVSALTEGKQMQYFGARCNLAKALLLAINDGRDEISGQVVVPDIAPLKGSRLDYQEVMSNFKKCLRYLVHWYAQTMNVIHYMHDKYHYESLQMALLNTNLERLMAFGIAGLSVVADSLSAIKHARVKVIRNDDGLSQSFEIKGKYPAYGNDDSRVDKIASDLVKYFNSRLQREYLYRKSIPTLSILTITSNVMYGKATGATPDGRGAGVPFAPGANPMHGRDSHGALASLASVAKLDYSCARDGISNTFTVVPSGLGKTIPEQITALRALLDGYFTKKGFHTNINVLRREVLEDAMIHPEKYPLLTIRVSGYAVRFCNLSAEHQKEVLMRTFHDKL